MSNSPSEHFKGKSVPEHLKEARKKGSMISAEMHGIEISGTKAAFADALRDTSMATTFLLIAIGLSNPTPILLSIAFAFLPCWIIWKTCRSALLGWARLNKLHRMIEEERWEIEHNREQEREELSALYEARGFSESLLTQVVDVLMADDNRLLQVMLDEELGLPLESYEHPLKQACGAFLGALIPSVIPLLFGYIITPVALPITLFLLFIGGGLFLTKLERGSLLPSFVWNLSIFCLCNGFVYFIVQIIFPLAIRATR